MHGTRSGPRTLLTGLAVAAILGTACGSSTSPSPSQVAQASAGAELFPGDILGTGTLGGGCLLEDEDPRYLQPGDVVELEVERLGVLRTEVVARPDS